MRKDDLITVTIEDLSSEGLGVGHYDGMAFFIKDTVIGDVAEAKIMKLKKTYGYARLTRLITPSPDRIAARCPVARQCGGCQIQAMSYPAQLRFKEAKVRNNLVRIGKFEHPPMEPIIGMEEPFRYRNKAQFPVGMSKDGRIIAGFYAGRTHAIIECEDCLLGVEENRVILDLVLEHMKEYHIRPYEELTGKGLVRHVMIRKGFATGAVMVCLIVNGDSLPHADALVERLRTIRGMASITLNINREQTNVIMGREIKLLWGQPYIEDTIGSVRFRISPLSFYQVNPLQTEKLYNKALEYAGLTGEETVWDLYCGIGTISLFLAQRAKQVYGVEIVPQAIEDAKNNALRNSLNNAEFFVGKAEEVVPRIYDEDMKKAENEPVDSKENSKENSGLPDSASDESVMRINPDVVVVDPPRKGCDETLLDTIVKMNPKRIVYVSCDSATLARDLKYLAANGYEIDRVQPVDQFAHTVHVETVVLLSHKKPDGHINVKVEFGEGEGKVPLDNIAKRAESYKPKERVTYKMIKEYIEAKYGFKVHTAYIAEVKRDLGLPMYDAPNAVEELKQPRKHPTAEKVEAIKDALKHFEVI